MPMVAVVKTEHSFFLKKIPMRVSKNNHSTGACATACAGAGFRFALGLLCVFMALVFAPLYAANAQQLYTCGMHPQVIKTEPGNCPICHMKLTPLGSAGSAAAGMDGGAAAQLAIIGIDPGIIQRMNLRTQEVSREAAQREVRTVGVVAFDERTQRQITTRYEGWIEKMFVNVSWQRVKKGDPLFEIYSPALYNAQLNYLVALRSEKQQTATDGEPTGADNGQTTTSGGRSGGQSGAGGERAGVNGGQGVVDSEPSGVLTAAALERLRLLGVDAAFIEALKTSGKAERTYIFRAPADGVVVEKLVQEGQAITAGQPVYSFASLSPVWVLAQVYEKDLPLVKAGQRVRVRGSYGAHPPVFEGRVAELLPQVQDATRAATARIELDNIEEALLPGMFADVRFVAELGDSVILVPDEAVLRSGEQNRVFVALGEGRFMPREVELGARTDDHRYVVQSGLQAGETVVVSGQFMLDSESRLREAIAKMVSAAGGAAAHDHAAGAGHAQDHGNHAQVHDNHVRNHAHGNAHSDAHGNHGHAHANEKHAHTGDGEAAHDHAANATNAANAAGAGHPHQSAMAADHSCCSAEGVTDPAEGQVQATLERREQMRRSPLVVLAFAAADAASALAKDDFGAYKEQLPALHKALESYAGQSQLAAGNPLAGALQNAAFTAPQTIAEAREAFAPFSNALTQTVAQANLHKSGIIHIFECPMVPKVGTGRWLQRENNNTWNPFFGAQMLHCGSIAQ